MNKKKICLFVCTYKRLELVDYVFGYYKKIKEEISDFCDLNLICVSSDGEKGKLICEKNGFEYFEYKNNPLSEKFNYACTQCKRHNPDGVLAIGSDDIISVEFFKEYVNLIEQKIDFFGVLDIFILTKNKLGYWSGYPKNSKRYGEPIGPGKFFSKNLIEKLNWVPWKGKGVDSGLDNLATNNLSKLKYTKKTIKCSDIGGFIVDIKTAVNITHPKIIKLEKTYDVEYIKKLGIDYDKIQHLLID